MISRLKVSGRGTLTWRRVGCCVLRRAVLVIPVNRHGVQEIARKPRVDDGERKSLGDTDGFEVAASRWYEGLVGG